ncbi:MAG TPA: hypothetical protein VKB84_03985 [Candidatus Binataceae bacterium]|nr:hypothetical protein [Candidatus Binataceae bacterium]
MKKINALAVSMFVAGLTMLAFAYHTNDQSISPPLAPRTPRESEHSNPASRGQPTAALDGEEREGENEAVEREQWELMRHGFLLGVPQNAYADAMAQRRRMEAISMAELASRPALAAPSWTFIGPQPMKGQLANFGGNLFGPTYDASGRVSAIAVDPAGNIYVGAASGGVWLSKDGGSHFTWISKALPTQSIGAIAIDTLAVPPIVYVGTGEGNSSIDSYYGLGLFSTTNFGATWTKVDPSRFSSNGAFQAFTSLAVPCSGNPFAGTGNGFSDSRGASFIQECEPSIFATGFNCMQGAVYESLGGTTWHRTFGRPNSMDPTGGPVRSLVVGVIRNPDLSAQPAMFGTIDGVGLVVTNDNTGLPFSCGIGALAGWSQLTTLPFSSVGRSSVSTGVVTGNPSSNQTVYTIVGAPNGGRYLGFLSSGSGGSSWLTQTTPCAATRDDGRGLGWSTKLSDCLAAGNLEIDGPLTPAPAGRSSSQAFYDQELAVWPGDSTAKTVFFAGLGIYRTTDGGVTWDFLAKNGGTHTDEHALAFNPSDPTKMYVGNDGGVYLFNTSANTWTSLNDTINAGQIQGIGPHPTDNNKALAGFQDNGTQIYSGSLGWDFTETGDGGFAGFDHVDPTIAYHTFASTRDSNGNSVPNVGVSNNGGAVNSWTHPGAIRAIMTFHGDAASFYPPFAVDPAIAERVLVGGHLMYASTDAMTSFQLMSPQNLTGCFPGCAITDIEFAPGDHTVAYTVASQAANGTTTFPFKVFVTTEANFDTGVVWTDITGGLGFDTGKTQATSIAVSPFNPKIAYLGISGYNSNTMIVTPPKVGHIFKTVDMGTHWAEADTGLPDIPVLKLIIDRTDPSGNTVLAGTDVGIFRTTNGGTSWSDFNLGQIPTTAVFDLEQNDNGVIFAGTHGSGAFKMVPPATPSPTPTSSPTKAQTPTATATRAATKTATRTPAVTHTPTKTATRTPTGTPTPEKPTSTATPVPSAPHINSIPKVILVGAPFDIAGLNFTGGSEVNFFIATSKGAINAGPLIPSAKTPTLLTVTVPPTTTLGEGFATLEVVNTDKGFAVSNMVSALLQGSPSAGIPSLTAINGVPLAATSSNPAFATNNVETVVIPGKIVKLGGNGFDITNGVAVDLFCACSGGKVGPFFLNPGNPNLTSTSVSFLLPATGSNAPATGPGSFVVSNAGASKTYSKKSNAVSVPIGQQISVTSVTQLSDTITVNGTGFSTLTVINFFNSQGGGVVNLGGVTPAGAPKIPLTFVSSNRLAFTKPKGALPGPSYVQALNPPFVPFTSSGSGPGGGFTLK